jgi:hypothetical protein
VLNKYDKTEDINKSEFESFNDHREDIRKIDVENREIILKALSYYSDASKVVKDDPYNKKNDKDGTNVFQRYVQQLVIYIVLSEIPLFITFFGFGRNIAIDKTNYRLVIGTELYGNISLDDLMDELGEHIDTLMKNNNILNLIIDLLLSYLCLQHFHISHGDYHSGQYVLATHEYHLKLLDFDDALYEPDSNMDKVNLLIGQHPGIEYDRIITNIINKFDKLSKNTEKVNVKTFSKKIMDIFKHISNEVITTPKNIINYIRSSTFYPINDYRTKIIKIINEKCLLLNVDPIFGELIYKCDCDTSIYKLL